MLYVGIDVAKSKHDCCILNENGKALSTFVIKNNKQGFEELIAEITRFSSVSDLSDAKIGLESTGHYSVRNYFLKETTAGTEILKNKKSTRFSIKGAVKPYANSYKYLTTHPVALVTVIANVIFYVYYIVGTNNSLYFAPYFIDGLKLEPAVISVLGAFYSAGMLFAMIVINPLMQKVNIFISLIVGAIVNIAGLVLLLVAHLYHTKYYDVY